MLAELNAMVANLVEKLGFECGEIEPHISGGHITYRVFIERIPPPAPGFGVTVDECAMVSSAISALLDAEDPIPVPYTLEVSSPGIFRQLKQAKDWTRAIGHRVKCQMKAGVTISGVLTDVEEDQITVSLETGVSIHFHRDAVGKATLSPVLNFGDESCDPVS